MLRVEEDDSAVGPGWGTGRGGVGEDLVGEVLAVVVVVPARGDGRRRIREEGGGGGEIVE